MDEGALHDLAPFDGGARWKRLEHVLFGDLPMRTIEPEKRAPKTRPAEVDHRERHETHEDDERPDDPVFDAMSHADDADRRRGEDASISWSQRLKAGAGSIETANGIGVSVNPAIG